MAQDQSGTRRRIVAGVDGSLPSRAALGWAVRHAALTGAAVEAIIAWEPPTGHQRFTAPDEDSRTIAAQLLADAIADAGSGPGLVRPSVRKGHPARVLIGASAQAELLVVGGRTPGGGFVRASLGPVSQRCVQHAHCPVVVIHADHFPDDMVRTGELRLRGVARSSVR